MGLAVARFPRRDHKVFAFCHGAEDASTRARSLQAGSQRSREASFTGRGSIQNSCIVCDSAAQATRPPRSSPP